MSETQHEESAGYPEKEIMLPHGLLVKATELGPDELIDSGEIDEPVPHFQLLELTGLVNELKARRTKLKLSLADVSERSGLTRAAVSRIENGWNTNPTLETLYRYALALNANIRLSAEDIEDEGEASEEVSSTG